jgi:ABC-type polysaccharide/polyol phosphate export permease
MKYILQLIELILTSIFIALIVANLIEIWYPDLRLLSAVVSFVLWFILGIRYFKFKNEMMKFRPTKN